MKLQNIKPTQGKKALLKKPTPEQAEEIINYWQTNKDNGINTLVGLFGYNKTAINKVISQHLASNKKPVVETLLQKYIDVEILKDFDELRPEIAEQCKTVAITFTEGFGNWLLRNYNSPKLYFQDKSFSLPSKEMKIRLPMKDIVKIYINEKQL